MNVQSITEDLENIAVSIAERSQIEFRSDRESFGGDLLERGFDSLDFVDYLLAIEEKYGCRVSEEDLEMNSLGSTTNMAKFLYERSKK